MDAIPSRKKDARSRRSWPLTCPAACGSAPWPPCCAARHGPAQYAARITEKPDGHCSIRCTIKALDQELFCLDIGTPDRLSADLVKKQFILKGNEVYQMLITKLTEETE